LHFCKTCETPGRNWKSRFISLYFAQRASPEETEKWNDLEIEWLRKGGCYEREKQRGKGRQEGATEKPQREEKDEEGEKAGRLVEDP